MNITKILCPIDYSVFSKAANYYASLFAEATGAEVIYLNVLWPPNNDGPIENQLDDLWSQLKCKITPLAHVVRHTYEVRNGNPATEILKLASEKNVDLIVMGTHGTTGLSRLLHGSICGKVLRNATCPVMAVKSSTNAGWTTPDEPTQSRPTQKSSS